MAMSGYRVEDLARITGTTVRNVRAYQEKGLLPPPVRVGRVALYDEAHLARLRLVLQLLDRGVNLTLIGDLIAAWQGGHDISDLLGLEAALVTASFDEIAALFGEPLDLDAIRIAVDLGIVTPEGDQLRVTSPRMLRIGAELVEMGVPLANVLTMAQILRTTIDDVAEQFIDLAAEHVMPGALQGSLSDFDPVEAAAVIRRLRPLLRAAVDTELARVMERRIHDRIQALLSDTDPPPENTARN